MPWKKTSVIEQRTLITLPFNNPLSLQPAERGLNVQWWHVFSRGGLFSSASQLLPISRKPKEWLLSYCQLFMQRSRIGAH